jgi:uncharacterized protein YgiM (DUF1202 family)
MSTRNTTHSILDRGRSAARACGVAGALLCLAGSAFGQAPTPTEEARVPTRWANVHQGTSSGRVILVLVPEGTVMPIIGRRGEWVQVQLSPELRKTGIVVRWYQNEESGWMHDSTVEITQVAQR